MCFTETQSYINAILLVISGIICVPYWRLYIPLIFLALKDILQGLLYRNIENKTVNNTLTKLSWIHICFQPLFVNMFLSQFSKNNNNNIYWNSIFIICALYGLYNITNLNDYDIQNDEDCKKLNNKNNFCSNETLSYIGKYHVGYRFSSDKSIFISKLIYTALTFIPSLLTSSRIVGFIWMVFVMIIYKIGNYLKLGNGETAAIWCFSSLLCGIPMAIIYKLSNK